MRLIVFTKFRRDHHNIGLNHTWLIEIWAFTELLPLLPARRYASAGNRLVIATCPSVCLSVRLSVTRRYCVKTKKASGMISSPSGSPNTLVFWRQISSPNSKGFPPSGGLKHGSVGKIQRFSSFKRQYLENGSRYDQSYYKWLIGRRTWAFDWHQDRWPWMTLNCCKVKFCRNFAWFRDWEAITVKRMKIDL